MNILHVLSQFEVNGAETFAATLADEQIKNGHTVFIISDTFQTTTKATVFLHPIGKRDLKQRFANISFLKQFIRKHNIHVIDAHSRAASWVSYFATRKGKTPLVSHIHAQQHIHFSSKNFPIYGEKLVAVCKTIYSHLNYDLKYSLDKLSLVKNGINLDSWNYQKCEHNGQKKIVAYVGRLSGFKGDTLLKLIEESFPKILEKIPEVEIHIIGGMNEKSKILPTIEKTNKRVGKDFIIPKGFSRNVQEIYQTADVVVGSGRVAMEALACGARVVAVGESNYVGILSEETKEAAVATNFGDLDKRQPIDTIATANDIVSVLNEKIEFKNGWGRDFIESEFNITNVAPALDAVYAEACALKNGIHELPVLLYHKIIPNEGTERIISQYEFERQLSFLKKNKFTPLTFIDLQRIIQFKLKIPEKPIVLTFDGFEENYQTAYPLLLKYGMTGVFFVLSQKTDQSPFLGAEQLIEMSCLGIEIGSYGATGTKLNLLHDEEVSKETQGSRLNLQEQIQSAIITFAYPHGTVSEQVKAIVRKSGYHFAVTIDDGRRNFWSDFLKIRRIQIFSGASAFSFWKKTSGWYYWYKNVY